MQIFVLNIVWPGLLPATPGAEPGHTNRRRAPAGRAGPPAVSIRFVHAADTAAVVNLIQDASDSPISDDCWSVAGLRPVAVGRGLVGDG